MKTFKRFLSAQEIDNFRRGGTRLAPGIWVDRAGGLHFSIPELLVLFGWPDDATHRALVLETVRDVVAATAPDCELIEAEERTH
jgi:hypothetical protein